MISGRLITVGLYHWEWAAMTSSYGGDEDGQSRPRGAFEDRDKYPQLRVDVPMHANDRLRTTITGTA
jgi:hypothetical protein